MDCQTSNVVPGRSTSLNRKCCDVHCNGHWSLWYGFLIISFETFIIYKSVSRFLTYVALPWPDKKTPYFELNLYVGLVGAGIVLLPFYFISFMFKIGNYANDGYKLGFSLSACALDPPSLLSSRRSGVLQSLWIHGGPIGPFLHLISAFCFLFPKIFIEAKLIQVDFLSKDYIWKTDLDWMVPHQDRLVILNFLTGVGTWNNITSSLSSTSSPYSHPADQIRDYLESDYHLWPLSPEFLNYSFALLVYGVRYASVFWNTNKSFALLFSLQLVFNAIQSLMSLGGMGIMIKVQMLGPQSVLHKYEPFLLNASICILLYLLESIVLTASSLVMYMYGYLKLCLFIETQKDKEIIRLSQTKSSLWSYFPHCSAMCVLIALSSTTAPLLYDYRLIYKGSYNGVILTTMIIIVLHLFTWIALWLFLTLRHNWKFKLRITVGRSVVKSARSIKLVSDVDLSYDDEEEENCPMLILGYGKTFSLTEPEPKKYIMKALARITMEKLNEEEDQKDERETKTKKDKIDDKNDEEETRDVNNMTPVYSTNTFTRRGGGLSPSKHKVTFVENERINLESSEQDGSQSSSPMNLSPLILHSGEHGVSDELPPPPGVNGMDYETNRLLVSPRGLCKRAPAAILSNAEVTHHHHHNHQQQHQDASTPRSNRSVDSGLPHDDITPRSESYSTTSSSASPPEQAIYGNDEWKGYSHKEEEASLYIRRDSFPTVHSSFLSLSEEDPYGRCTNMKLSTFEGNGSKDPRIIDLGTYVANGPSEPLTNKNPISNTPNSFNTLPVNMNHRVISPSNNLTLPARVTMTPRNLSGRHFKPFDHRKMNPMAGIQESQEISSSAFDTLQPSNSSSSNVIVQRINTHLLPGMPAELRHTNYSSSPLVTSRVFDHRDSANLSVISSDSG